MATRTTNFGAGKRESHDARDFYARFTPPELSADATLGDPAGLPSGCLLGDSRDLSPAQVKMLWDEIKQEEKAERRLSREKPGLVARDPHGGFLGGIPTALPALTRAQKLTAKAAKVGFDWPEPSQVIGKIHEELEEVKEASSSGDRDRVEDEIGDLLFAVSNLARHYGVDPEAALRRTNAKFERRFGAIERGLERKDRTLEQASLDEMEELWVEAKRTEREPGSS